MLLVGCASPFVVARSQFDRRVNAGPLDSHDKIPASAPLGTSMHLTVAKLLPYVSIAAGVLILIHPRLLSFVIAAYLIVTGLIGLNDIYHFVR
jgi:hypothetical protein